MNKKWKSIFVLAVVAIWMGTAGMASAVKGSGPEMQPGSIAIERQKKNDCLHLVKISPEEAMRIATDETKGKVISLDLKKRDGFLVYKIKTITPAKSVVNVTVDPGTGSVLRVKERTSKQL